MSETHSPESHGSETSDTSDMSDTPISGSVKDFDFVDDGTLLVEVDDADGDRWYETYEFVIAESARNNDRTDEETDD